MTLNFVNVDDEKRQIKYSLNFDDSYIIKKNYLPVPLEHGKNIHFVEDNNLDAIKEAVLLLTKDVEYKRKLEKGAISYWKEYGTPEKSLELLGIK